MAFYDGSLLSQQYPGIKDEHQAKLRAAFAVDESDGR